MLDWEALCNASQLAITAIYNFLQHYLDIAYLGWLAWLFWPLLVTFILPVSMLLFLYASAFFLHMYRLRHTLRDAVQRQRDHWDGARNILAAIWDAQGRIWHGYEVFNVEKIPDQGGAVIAYYHGALPIDMYYLMAHCILHKRRLIRPIGDRFLFRVPGFKLLMDVMGVIPGSRSSCNKLLTEGNILSIAPGGLREAQFGDSNYQMMWNSRQGFAKIAIDSKVPIIPVFTQNVREAVRSVSLGQSFFRYIYERYRLPCVPIYGMFPVKLRTFIGDPIPYDPSLDSDQLTRKAQEAIESLIVKHQKIPGNILQALLERFYTPAHCKPE